MHGIIEWFTKNHVAANLLMLLIVGMGAYATLYKTPLEVFPAFELDIVNVSVVLPAATPGEVEESISIRIEEALFDLDGIEQVTSYSSESVSQVQVEIKSGYEPRDLMNDIKSRVDAINTFPSAAERPVVNLVQMNREVISVTISGDLSEKELRILGEQSRDELLNIPGLSQVYLESVRDYEIEIAISEATLQEYGLTLAQVANTLQQQSVDLSGGTLKTQGGDILLRAKGQAYTADDYRQLPIISTKEGVLVRLNDIATINDGFVDTPIKVRFNNQPAVLIEVYRVGEQSAIEVAQKVKDYIADKAHQLPDNVKINYWRDSSRIVKARLNTLINSAMQGGLLVMLLLSLFLRPAIAFWVCVGIPISFLGGLWLMPMLGISLNLISLFAFILVLGIVVDDAIVTAENVYSHQMRGQSPLQSAIRGTQEVSVPVTFGILTTVAAFVPLTMIEGARGQIFLQIPAIVIPVLLFSLIESKLILPAHLKHVKMAGTKHENTFSRFQRRFADGFENVIIQFYKPLLHKALNAKLTTVALAIALAIIVFSVVASGWTRFIFFPKVPSETARASLVMPSGTPFVLTDSYIELMTEAAETLQDKYSDSNGQSIVNNILAISGSSGRSAGSHLGNVKVELQAPEKRRINISSQAFVKEWRQTIGQLAGIESLSFKAEIGHGGSPLDIQLTGQDFEQLKQLGEGIKQQLRTYPSLFDITDSLSGGKQELQLTLNPKSQTLGLTLTEVARQVRQAFYGFEVQRLQRGRDDLKVFVRFPKTERRSLFDLNNMMIRTQQGAQIPFNEVASLSPTTSPARIIRIDRNRTIDVTADMDKKTADVGAIKRDLQNYLDENLPLYPGVSASLEGEAKEQRQSMGSLLTGLVFVIFVVYGLLAIPFKSYWQPIIVMSVIPFGAVGAIIGHWAMGMPLTIMSMMGMLALTGVVVNDSLVLVDYINKQRQAGMPLLEAVQHAGMARFRPVLLTSMTTFAGLLPLIFGKSTQAQFLIPMAVSLGFGILFATIITLIIVPVNYMIMAKVTER